MMDLCGEIRERFDDWLEDSLSDADRKTIEGHLKACDACRRFFDYHETLANDLMALGRAADRMAAGRTAAKPVSHDRIRPLQVAAIIALFIVPGMIIKRVLFDQVGQPTQVVSNDPRERAEERPDDPGDQSARPPDSSDFHFSHDDDRLAVRMKSDNPRVHIVWLYDTIPPPEDGGNENNPSGSDSAG